MAWIGSFSPRSPRRWPASEVAAPRRIFGRRRARAPGGGVQRLRQHLRWYQFRHPLRATLAAVLLPLLVIGAYAATRGELPAPAEMIDRWDTWWTPAEPPLQSTPAVLRGNPPRRP